MRYARTFFVALAVSLAAAWAMQDAPADQAPSASAVCDGFGRCWMEIDSYGDHVI